MILKFITISCIIYIFIYEGNSYNEVENGTNNLIGDTEKTSKKW